MIAKQKAVETMRKCFNCRKEIKSKKKIFCKDCEKKPVKTTSTFIIFDKI